MRGVWVEPSVRGTSYGWSHDGHEVEPVLPTERADFNADDEPEAPMVPA